MYSLQASPTQPEGPQGSEEVAMTDKEDFYPISRQCGRENSLEGKPYLKIQSNKTTAKDAKAKKKRSLMG